LSKIDTVRYTSTDHIKKPKCVQDPSEITLVTTKIKTATVSETYQVLQANKHAIMIDVREQSEIDEAAPAVGVFFPMSKINPETFASECNVKKDQPIFLFCRSGGRSMRVAEALATQGYTDLTNVTGGILAWQAEGLPLKHR
jgi:rhodanese-related sulfurtransferase